MTIQSVMHGAPINGVGNKKPKESDQVIAGHGSLHRVYFSLLLHPWPSQRSRAGATVVSYQRQF
jgi:hypothetical protein